MFSELQIRAARLLQLLARVVQRQPIDFGDIELPAGSVPGIPAEDGPLAVDHLEFPEFSPGDIPGGVLRTVAGPARIFRYSPYIDDVQLIEAGKRTRPCSACPYGSGLCRDPAPPLLRACRSA